MIAVDEINHNFTTLWLLSHLSLAEEVHFAITIAAEAGAEKVLKKRA